jgi:hypothetical protein
VCEEQEREKREEREEKWVAMIEQRYFKLYKSVSEFQNCKSGRMSLIL